MANIGWHGAKQMLDWVLGGAAATQPPQRFIALSSGVPTTNSAMGEIQVNSGYSRQTATFGSASTPAGSASASNIQTMAFGPFSSVQTIQGLLVYDTHTINSGNIWWYGTLLTTRTVLANDTLLIAQGGLIITLS